MKIAKVHSEQFRRRRVDQGMNQARAWSHHGNREELEEQCDDEGDREDDLDATESPMPTVMDYRALSHIRQAKRQAKQTLRTFLDRVKAL